MDEFIIEAKLENMDAVLNFINVRIGNCPKKIQNQIGIAVDELFSNIAHYAYPSAIGSVAVRIAAGELIIIEFEDAGVEYNPLSANEPDTTLSDEEREIGGLGIFMVKNIMDSVEYRRVGDKNVLTIKKRLMK